MATKTVLLVDDEPHIRYMLQLKLEAAGFRVLVAVDGRQAYELATKRFPSVVVTDYQMPVSDGLELCRKLKDHADTSRIPIVMLTARGHRIPREELEQTNVQEVLAKPFSLRELIRKINALLETGSSRQPPNSATGASAA
ncbi:MAG: response regulator [Planctomycetota bacterium]